MRVQILHDNSGNVYSIVAPVEGSRRGGIQSPTPDRTVIEVDAPDITVPTHAEERDAVAAKLA